MNPTPRRPAHLPRKPPRHGPSTRQSSEVLLSDRWLLLLLQRSSNQLLFHSFIYSFSLLLTRGGVCVEQRGEILCLLHRSIHHVQNNEKPSVNLHIHHTDVCLSGENNKPSKPSQGEITRQRRREGNVLLNMNVPQAEVAPLTILQLSGAHWSGGNTESPACVMRNARKESGHN